MRPVKELFQLVQCAQFCVREPPAPGICDHSEEKRSEPRRNDIDLFDLENCGRLADSPRVEYVISVGPQVANQIFVLEKSVNLFVFELEPSPCLNCDIHRRVKELKNNVGAARWRDLKGEGSPYAMSWIGLKRGSAKLFDDYRAVQDDREAHAGESRTYGSSCRALPFGLFGLLLHSSNMPSHGWRRRFLPDASQDGST
ncbi:MAG TPA: hypothetical protein VM166_08060, partial [Gemmatimonadaceae bacterium]|nr:hypothetical protein [Gemmatimonadaceae bacterium]